MSTSDSNTVSRTLRVLEELALGPCSATQLAARLDAHPRTIRRVLNQLVAAGFAVPSDERRGAYTATLKLVALAGRVLDRTDLVGLAFPYVARLRNLCGEASHFSVPSGEGVLHLVQETGESVVMVKPRLGELVPYHSTASGKALLAHRPELLDGIIGSQLPRFTENTLTDPADLLLDLSRVRERGYAIDEQEQSLDLRCVAAPVFDHAGQVIGCIGISAPAMRLGAAGVPEVGTEVAKVAGELSATLGHISSHRSTASNPRVAL
jgi:DNA-binding IclR family transcriptional regulator